MGCALEKGVGGACPGEGIVIPAWQAECVGVLAVLRRVDGPVSGSGSLPIVDSKAADDCLYKQYNIRWTENQTRPSRCYVKWGAERATCYGQGKFPLVQDQTRISGGEFRVRETSASAVR